MTSVRTRFLPVIALAVLLAVMVGANIRPYGWNITAIFHMDPVIGAGNPLPPDFVVLNVPSYDGAQYYQVARNVPAIFQPSRWHELAERTPASYAYQRFLLPLLAWILSLGSVTALPYLFLLINIAALLLTSVLILRNGKTPAVYALALCLSPAAVVAMHFTLAEPLTILLITFVLLRIKDGAALRWPDLLALCLVVLAREVNILFIAYLMGWYVLNRRPKDALLLLLPAAAFLGWHRILFEIFGNIPFFTSTGARQLPGSAAAKILFGMKGWNRLTLSSVALMVGFVFPCLAFVLRDIVTRRRADLLSLGALAFFGVMFIMPDYIWGSITSIGRVITPVYPLTILLLAERNTTLTRGLAGLMLCLSGFAAAGLALSSHGYVLTT